MSENTAELAKIALDPNLAVRDLEELGRFCRHDFIEPIRTLGIGLDLLDTDDIDSAERTTLAAHMHSSVRDLNRVVQRLVEYLKLSTARPSDVDIEEAAAASFGATQIRFPMAPVRLHVAAGSIVADPMLLCDLLTELMDNAARHGGGQTERHLHLDHEHTASTTTLWLHEPDATDWTADPTQVELFRASRSGGPGVGLAICRRIAELHGGTVELMYLDGSPGVRIELPR